MVCFALEDYRIGSSSRKPILFATLSGLRRDEQERVVPVIDYLLLSLVRTRRIKQRFLHT